MNILPKKRWHVRNRDNIARVRKDEAEAAEKNKEIERRMRLAEQEAKIEFMRKQTQQRYGYPTETEKPRDEKTTELPSAPSTTSDKHEHVNFFKDLEEGAVVTNATNKEHEQEVKQEKEKYEKQIGYLTYLGQDTNEATGKISWYERPRTSLIDDDDGVENDARKKLAFDPVHKYRKFFNEHRFVSKPIAEKPKSEDNDEIVTKSKKLKKHKKHKSKKKKRNSDSNSSSSDDEQEMKIKKQKLELLRLKRLKREREEKARADQLLARMRGETIKEPVKEPEPPPYKQKYNSQFNPHLAKQNSVR